MGWMVNATPWPLYPWERYRCILYRRLGGPSEPVWTGAGNVASPDLDPRTVQPVARQRFRETKCVLFVSFFSDIFMICDVSVC